MKALGCDKLDIQYLVLQQAYRMKTYAARGRGRGTAAHGRGRGRVAAAHRRGLRSSPAEELSEHGTSDRGSGSNLNSNQKESELHSCVFIAEIEYL
jgi:hypothetical protein